MYHLVLLFIVGVMASLGWMLVCSAPRILSLYLPSRLTFGVGAGFFTFAVFSAFIAAFALREPVAMLDSFISVIVGVWFMFAASAGLRGSAGHDDLMNRVAKMLALLVALIVTTLYVNDPRIVSLLSLALVAVGYLVGRDYLTGSRR